MSIFALIIGIIVCIGVLVVFWKPFFGNLAGFLECVKFWLTPDVISLFRGEWGEDRWAEMKLAIWLFSGIISGIAAYAAITHILS